MKSVRLTSCAPGFTLMELLVVMAVLSIFLIMTSAVTRDALDLHGATKARLVAERNAAAFLRQFDADIFQRVNRQEARARIGKHQGNDEISLVTRRQGYAILGTTADRRVSLVSYRIAQNMLERAASGYGFGKPPERPAEKTGTLALKEIPATGPDVPADKAFQVIAPGIIRLEFSFLVREAEKRVLRAEPPPDQQQIEAVIATVAVLDPDRRRMLDAGKLGLIAAEFPDAADNALPAPKWDEVAANLSRKLPALPRTALQQVRVYQGIFTFPNLNPLP